MKSFKLFFVTVFFILSLVTLVMAGEAVPGETSPFLRQIRFRIDQSKYEAIKHIDLDGVRLFVNDNKGEKIWESPIIGSEDKAFMYHGNSSGLAAVDVTGDGRPELVTASFYGPQSSAMYVYRYSPDSETIFEAVPFVYEEEELVRDFMVSDIFVENGEDLAILENGMIRALGMVYPEEPEAEPEAAFYYFTYESGQFLFNKKEPVPAEEQD